MRRVVARVTGGRIVTRKGGVCLRASACVGGPAASAIGDANPSAPGFDTPTQKTWGHPTLGGVLSLVDFLLRPNPSPDLRLPRPTGHSPELGAKRYGRILLSIFL